MGTLTDRMVIQTEALRRFFPVAVFFLIVVVFSVLSAEFRTWTNISNIAKQSAVLIVAALGETLVILAGSIDLSVGSLLGLSANLTAGASNVIGPWSILVRISWVGLR